MNPWHLIWIIPLSAAVGFFWAAILAAGRDVSQEPEVVESEWVNIKPCTNDAVEYADYVTFLARTQMHIEWWECKNCGGFDQGASTRKPRHCRCCGALMRNGDFDKSEMNIGARMDAPERVGEGQRAALEGGQQ